MSAHTRSPWFRRLGQPARRAALAIMLLGSPAIAQMAVPTIRDVKPMGLSAGKTTTIELGGSDLAGSSAVLFDDPDIKIEAVELANDRIKLRVAQDTAPGVRSFRLVTPKGLSNPGRIVVGRPVATIAERGPNHGFKSAQAVSAPVMIEGKLANGDETDVYAVEMSAGQTLVAEAFAARAGSGLDALVTIFSPDGRELASDDDLFGRDAAAWATVLASGRYFVQIQDANGRNRDGAIEGQTTRPYLLTIGEVPLVISAYPAGGRRGFATPMNLIGLNLLEGRDHLFEPPANSPLGDMPLLVESHKGVANALNVRVGDGPEWVEPDPEPADDPVRPAPVPIPGAINGRFAAIDDGDIDYYRLQPAAGQEGDYAITVYAAKLGSAADPVVAVVDPRGNSQAEDDDKLGRDARIEQHIGAEGLVIAVRDAFRRGGPRFIYRIEVEPIARRRIIATADLGGRTIPRDGSIAVPISLERLDDDGPATILAGELPPGVTAAPVTIPAKGKGGLLVLSAAKDAPLGPFPFRLVVRDVRGGFEAAYRERGDGRPAPGPNAGKVDGAVIMNRPMLAVSERAPLGLAIEPDEVNFRPGDASEIRVKLDRRGDDAKRPVKLRLLASEGGLSGFDRVDEATVPADRSEHVFQLKAGGEARRTIVTVRGWFEGAQETQGVDAKPAALNVR